MSNSSVTLVSSDDEANYDFIATGNSAQGAICPINQEIIDRLKQLQEGTDRKQASERELKLEEELKRKGDRILQLEALCEEKDKEKAEREKSEQTKLEYRDWKISQMKTLYKDAERKIEQLMEQLDTRSADWFDVLHAVRTLNKNRKKAKDDVMGVARCYFFEVLLLIVVILVALFGRFAWSTSLPIIGACTVLLFFNYLIDGYCEAILENENKLQSNLQTIVDSANAANEQAATVPSADENQRRRTIRLRKDAQGQFGFTLDIDSITRVLPGSPAQEAGMQKGDRIVYIENADVQSKSDYDIIGMMEQARDEIELVVDVDYENLGKENLW